MIKAVVFDCFGVLTTDHWRTFVDSLPPDMDVERCRELNRQYDAGLLSREAFIEQIYEVTDRSPQQVELLLDNEIVKNEPLFDYMRELKQEGIKLGLLSNVGTDWITSRFLTTDEQTLFDAMIFSYEVKITKPDPRIFQLAAERLDLEPAEIIFVDDISHYCEAASQVGMQTVTYSDFRQCQSEIERLLSHT